jgi:hypothetical protein
MCCLGFACVAAGVSLGDIAEIGCPDSIDMFIVEKADSDWMDKLLKRVADPDTWETRGYSDSSFTSDAIGINDDTKITLAERERQLTTLFALNGIELEFIGDAEVSE